MSQSLFGLLGRHISYSRSPDIYRTIWTQEGVTDCQYALYDTDDIQGFVRQVRATSSFIGFNVTIPHKQAIIPYLDELSDAAREIGAVNTVVRIDHTDKGCRLIGHNTDVDGFAKTLERLKVSDDLPALIAGTGGVYRAVRYVFNRQGRPFVALSRTGTGINILHYEEVDDQLVRSHPLIVNCTPLGSTNYPDQAPSLPYDAITSDHLLVDLVYTPPETCFMKEGKRRGARVINGEYMLQAQAGSAWSLWRPQVLER